MKLWGYLTYEQEPKHGFYRTGVEAVKNGYFTIGNSVKTPVNKVKRSINNFGAIRLDFWVVIDGKPFHGVLVGDTMAAWVKPVKKVPTFLKIAR